VFSFFIDLTSDLFREKTPDFKDVEVLLSSFEEIKILGFSSEAALYEICARL
jgi:hypothetical protein